MYNNEWDKQDFFGAIQMWHSVILQAMEDANSEYWHEVVEWVDTKDFDNICNICGLNTKIVRLKILEKVQDND